MPSLAVMKLASCDGCQLSLLDCEDELLAIADRVKIAHFAEASSELLDGPYDVTLVEGSITNAHDAERLQKIRARSRVLVAIGVCATAGGIQASATRSTRVADHVKVDVELPGCPVDKHQLLEVLSAVVNGRRPAIDAHPVCLDCKLAGRVCVAVAGGMRCLGPSTRSGCGALCPAFSRGCYGCFGPLSPGGQHG